MWRNHPFSQKKQDNRRNTGGEGLIEGDREVGAEVEEVGPFGGIEA